MGTRGFISFVVDGQEKTTYNHFDSYPGGVGVQVLDFCRGDMELARRMAAALRVVRDDSAPTEEQQNALRGFADLSVSRQSLDDWYVLLRHTQGQPGAILAAGYLLDASEFPLDSLFAEYGYVIDFDSNVLEAYRGFQHEPHDKGRWASKGGNRNDYYPCALAASWPLDALPTDDEFCQAIEPDEDEA